MKRQSLRRAGIAGTVILGLATGGQAFATAGSGVSATLPIRGVADEKVRMHGANLAYEVVIHDITIAPGGHTGWHTHPGVVLVLVKSGKLTIYDADPGCSKHDYGAGLVYVDPGYGDVHIGRNETAGNTELQVIYLDVPIGGAFRLDAADPGYCSS